MNLSDEEIRDRATYHAPTPTAIACHAALSSALEDFLRVIRDVCPDSREASVAATHAETAKMWASAAVARNQGSL